MFSLDTVAVAGAPPRVAGARALRAPTARGSEPLALDSSEIDRRLGALHDIAGYTYDRDFPHTLRVTVKPEHPVAVCPARSEGLARGGELAGDFTAAVGTPDPLSRGSGSPIRRIDGRRADHGSFRAPSGAALALARLAHFRGRIRIVRAARASYAGAALRARAPLGRARRSGSSSRSPLGSCPAPRARRLCATSISAFPSAQSQVQPSTLSLRLRL